MKPIAWDAYFNRFCTCDKRPHKTHCGRIYQGHKALGVPYRSALRWDQGEKIGPGYLAMLQAKGIKPPKR